MCPTRPDMDATARQGRWTAERAVALSARPQNVLLQQTPRAKRLVGGVRSYHSGLYVVGYLVPVEVQVARYRCAYCIAFR